MRLILGAKVTLAGLLGGFVGNGILGVIFTLPLMSSILYDPTLQSELFLAVTPERNIPLSVAGLIVLSVIHAWLYWILSPSIPGDTWLKKGLFWGGVIWAVYWLFQEWFIYITLLGEPLSLAALELLVLLLGALAEGVVIAAILKKR